MIVEIGLQNAADIRSKIKLAVIFCQVGCHHTDHGASVDVEWVVPSVLITPFLVVIHLVDPYRGGILAAVGVIPDFLGMHGWTGQNGCKYKEQYSKGKVNMNAFSKYSKSEAKVKEAKKLIDDNKFNEAIELCEKEINE